MKTRGFNLIDLGKDDSDFLLNIKSEQNMQQYEKPKKKKIKFNFDHLFPAPKNNKNMGMDNICNGEPFEGLF